MRVTVVRAPVGCSPEVAGVSAVVVLMCASGETGTVTGAESRLHVQ